MPHPFRPPAVTLTACLLAYPLWVSMGAGLVPADEGDEALVHAATAAQLDSVRAAFALHLRQRDTAALAVDLLTAAEQRRLRRAPYAAHRRAAEGHGVARVPRRAGHAVPDGLKAIPDSSRYYVIHDGTGLLSPRAVASLDEVGRRFHELLAAEGLPPVRFSISSAYRSAHNQHRLRRRNRNATRGVSSHEYGASYDLAYRRFAPPLGHADAGAFELGASFPVASAGQLRRELVLAEADWAANSARRYRSRYEALLGRALIELEDEGAVYALREVRQPCFHVTARPNVPRA